MKALLDGLRALGPARLAAMGAVALGMLGMLALMVLRGGTEPMALLYGDLDLRDAVQVVDQLTRQHIPYRIAANGSQILVPADQVPEARLSLAKEGLPAGGSVGYEIFDRSDGLAATEFQQKINETRALEGELARTIRAMQRRARRARAPGAAAARAVRARPPGRPGQRHADHGRRRPAGPRRRPGDPQPGRRRGAGTAPAEHRHRRFARRPAGARRRTGGPGRPPR